MKVRTGFVSNSSSSSFVLWGNIEKSKEGLRSVFVSDKKAKKILKNDRWWNNGEKISISQMLDRLAQDLLESYVSEKEYTGEGYTLNSDLYTVDKSLMVLEVPNWAELLEDRNSWLYKKFAEGIVSTLRNKLSADSQAGDVDHHTSIFENYKLDFEIPLYRSSVVFDEIWEQFSGYLVDYFMERWLKEFKEDEKYFKEKGIPMIFYIIDAATDGKSVSGWFLRQYFGDMLIDDVSYLFFDYS